MQEKRHIGALIAIASMAAAAYIFSTYLTASRQDAWLEIFKFLLFTCVASGALLLYRSIEASSDVRRQNKQAVESFRKDFLAAYHQLKMVRRDFRFITAVEAGDLHILDAERFANSYHTMNNAYVEFELLRKSISGSGSAFEDISTQIEADMRSVDKYIRKIMIELENVDWKTYTSVPISKVELFHSFLYTDGNPVHVAASKSLDRFLVLASEGD